MSIVEIQRTYNLKPILEESIEISKFNFERAWKMGGYGIPPTENMVTFGFGRQCGHTTTIQDYLNSNIDLKQNTLVVVHNQQMVKEYKKGGIDKVVSASSNHQTVNFMVGRSDMGIIFDTCSHKAIWDFFNNIMPYIRGSNGLKFVVNVAPVF